MLWPIFWTTLMVGLIAVTTFVAMREKKARTQAIKAFAPQPLGDVPDAGIESIDDGFGEPDPVDAFDMENAVAMEDEKS